MKFIIHFKEGNENMEFDLSGGISKMCLSVIDFDLPLVSNLANVSSLLFSYFKNTTWCGFYLSFEDKEELFLGPFQGEVACTRIPFGKGACGNACAKKTTQLIPNVHLYEGHIACSKSTNSEIVVPIILDGKVKGVIDLDSDKFANFTYKDKEELEEIANILSPLFAR